MNTNLNDAQNAIVEYLKMLVERRNEATEELKYSESVDPNSKFVEAGLKRENDREAELQRGWKLALDAGIEPRIVYQYR